MTRRRNPKIGLYHRRNLGGGNALKAVTRARRSAPGRQLCQGVISKPVRWRVHERRAREAAMEAVFDAAVARETDVSQAAMEQEAGA